MSKSTTVNDQLPEAAASVTAKVVTPNGFQLLFTLRDKTGSSLLAKYEEFEKAALAKGWKPQAQTEKPWNRNINSGFSTQASVSRGAGSIGKNGTSLGQVKGVGTTCAKCGAPALKKSGSRKDNSRWEGVFCSTGDESHKLWLS